MIIMGAEFRVRGLVQGVGFRPTVWRLAHSLKLSGEVLNDGAGVLIRAWGTPDQLSAFEAALARNPPPLARIAAIERAELREAPPTYEFRIATTMSGDVSTGIVADAATCRECLAEILDPGNRRYRYAFTNCTHCGPRLSIVHTIPYDRVSTSMAAFTMCNACQAEYENPADRRFHAEPNACPVCGPKLWLEDKTGRPIILPVGEDVITRVAAMIGEGAIVAIKGIGGFHLACDAANDRAVAELRQRKRRYHKPFALMARDLNTVRAYVEVGDGEAELLLSPASPIVILERRQDAPELAAELAPGQSTLGFMLPYTPLHHLLMREVLRPIVLTSGNGSDEPQCIGNEESRRVLHDIADVWVMHDRDIINRLDDSVVRVVDGTPSIIRRARGYAPEPIALPHELAGTPRILALGAELKNTFCILSDGKAILSQHLGDLEDAAVHGEWRAALRLYRQMFAFDPEMIAVDIHPDYFSTQWGRALAHETGARLVEVQHHHAHVGSVLAEHGIEPSAPPVLGIILDGLGLGMNGELWGGEFLVARYDGFERLASFADIPLIGGNRAIREPWRNAFAHLHAAFGWREWEATNADLDIVRFGNTRHPEVLVRMVESGLNAPRASSAGRLFDAAAAILGLCREEVTYEGQAAVMLEALAAGGPRSAGGYPVEIVPGSPTRIRWGPFWAALVADLKCGRDRSLIAARVHQGVVDAVVEVATRISSENEVATAVLSGGVFQNRLLAEGVTHALRKAGMTVLMPRALPANDGGLSLGQAVIASAGTRFSGPFDKFR